MLKTVNWNNKELHTIQWLVVGEMEWVFFGKEVIDALEYDLRNTHSYTKYISKYCSEDEIIKVKAKELGENLNTLPARGFKIGRKGEYLITESATIKLISNSKILSEVEKESLIDSLKLNEKYIILKSTKEINFIDKLEKVLKPLEIKGIKQYQVMDNKYRIDYYIPKFNLAIEYDENEHKGYSYKKQEGRQKEIEKELNCEFIRISDDNCDEYNIGYIIKRIWDKI